MNDEKTELINMMNRYFAIDSEIINRIRNFLKAKDCPYLYDEKHPSRLSFVRELDHKEFMMHIFLQSGKISLRCDSHLFIQANTYSMICVYANEFNNNVGTFGFMTVDPGTGKLSVNYSYQLNNSAEFSVDLFWNYATALFSSSLNTYTKAAHLAIGMVDSDDEKKLYKKLSEMTLNTIDGNFDISEITYDVESLKNPPSPYADLLKDFYKMDPGGKNKSPYTEHSMNEDENKNYDCATSEGGNNND